MALAVTVATSGQDSTDSASYSTAAITADADSLYLFAINGRDDVAVSSAPSVTGAGQTWALVKHCQPDRTGGSQQGMSVFAAAVSTSGSGAIGATYGVTMLAANWVLLKITGAKSTTATAIVQSATAEGSSNTATVNLSAFASANNMAVGFFSNGPTVQNMTPGSGFTELYDVVSADFVQLMAEHKLNDTSVDATWTTSGEFGAIALEIAELLAVSLSGSVTPTGTLSKQANKGLTGSITPTGTLATLIARTISLVGSITPTGAVSFLTSKLLSGSITPSGVVTLQRIHQHLRALVAGTLELVGLSRAAETLTARTEGTLDLTALSSGTETLSAQSENTLELTILEEEEA